MRHDYVSKLAKPKDAQDEHHDHDQTDDVDNVIHVWLPIWLPSLVTGQHNRETIRAGSNNHSEITGSRLRCSALPPISSKLTGCWAGRLGHRCRIAARGSLAAMRRHSGDASGGTQRRTGG
jgi:hypothetical protein